MSEKKYQRLAIAAADINHKEFEREAKNYAKYWESFGENVRVEFVDMRLPKKLRREVVEGIIRATLAQDQPVNEVALFCHGGKNWLQTGHSISRWRRSIDSLVDVLQCNEKSVPDVILYACKCGKANGLAGELARGLGISASVWAHESRGHTTYNPQLVICTGWDLHKFKCVERMSLCEGKVERIKWLGGLLKSSPKARYDLWSHL
jgi:hypothetical protein